MSFLQKDVNPVGRPSNETLKKRRNKKIAIVAACIVGVLALGGGAYVLLTGGNLFNLMGNSVTKYTSMYICPSNTTLQGDYCRRGDGQTSKPKRVEYFTPALNQANVSEHKRDSNGKISYNISLPTFIHGTLPSDVTIGIEYQIYSNGKWGVSVPNPLSGNKGKTVTDAFSIDFNNTKKVRIRGYIVNGSKKEYTGWSNEITVTNNKKNTFTLTLVGNGASVGKTTLSCTTVGTSCKVTLPSISRGDGWSVLGLSEIKNATDKNVLVPVNNGDITINRNVTYYVISKKTVTAKFYNNTKTNVKLSFTGGKSCTLYNTALTCEVQAPTIKTPTYYSTVGFATSMSATKADVALTNNKIKIYKDVTYYPIVKKNSTYTVTIQALGSTLEGTKTRMSCTPAGEESKGCTVTLPKILKAPKGKNARGYSKKSASTVVDYKSGEKITVKNNMTLYVVLTNVSKS